MKQINKRVGIMGGTFNPIHMGHLLLAENARECYSLDEIIFIPSGCSYMKSQNEIAVKEMRFEMTRLAIEENPFFNLSALEIERPGNTYTFETLSALKQMETNAEFYFIVGADSLFSIETWKRPEIIFKSCIILAAVREGKDNDALNAQAAYLSNKFNAQIKLLPLHEIAISSTDIRNRIRQNRSIRYMVPDKVISYIEEHHLYI